MATKAELFEALIFFLERASVLKTSLSFEQSVFRPRPGEGTLSGKIDPRCPPGLPLPAPSLLRASATSGSDLDYSLLCVRVNCRVYEQPRRVDRDSKQGLRRRLPGARDTIDTTHPESAVGQAPFLPQNISLLGRRARPSATRPRACPHPPEK